MNLSAKQGELIVLILESDENRIGVYKIESPSGKTYVGMTCDSFAGRLSGHRKYLKAGKHHCKGLQRAYAKYGLDNLKITILESWEKPESKEDVKILGIEILAREAFWWREIHSSGAKMYNGEPSGTGSVFHTSETRMRIAQGQLRFAGLNELPIILRDQICAVCGILSKMPSVRKTCSDECFSERMIKIGKLRALDIPSRDLVEDLWMGQELTVIECQEILGIRTGRFYKILDHYNLPRRPNLWLPRREMPKKEILMRLYSVELFPLRKIMKLVGLSERKLNFVLDYYSIPKRPRINR